ncbi:MAG: (2Fe-2S) ferredoxin domain-containing protein [Planktothrix sp. GU0601_MAG3]|nr:MAG: (2Fe-2S) ferredoxin domain-containing protein [Planktothrix sp. GU0601_MAG3]
MCLKQVFVCQNRTCRKQGSDRILALFEEQSDSGIKIQGIGCLGKCGSGPIVIILPDEVWYYHFNPRDVPRIIQQYLSAGCGELEN